MPALYGFLDLQKNELRQAQIQNLASAPSSPVKGQLWFDSTNNILKWYDGGTWISAMGGAGAVPSDSVSTQAIGDAAVPGSSALYARGDHKHAMPAFGAVTAQTTYGTASNNGAAATLARSDHVHGTPSLTAVTPSTQAIGDAAAVGSGSAPAREDHKHAMPAFGASTATTTFGLTKSDGAAVSLARSDHTHGTPTHDAAAHSGIPLNSLAAATGIVYMGGFVLANLGTPSAGSDAATKAYVDSLSAGLAWTAPVRVATTANVGLTGLAAIDGVTPIANDRILVKNQSTPAQNGIYLAQSGAWTRALDADAANELLNAAVFVSEGSTQSDTAWVSTANAPITVGTTALPWVQFSGAGTYTNGTGITLTGNVFAIDDSVVATDAQVTSAVSTKADSARTVTAGAGLSGGGDLSANRTIDFATGDTTLTVSADSVVVNTAVIATRAYVDAAAPPGMAKKYAGALVGTSSPETVTHNLNTRDIQLTVLNGSTPYTAVEVDWDATTVNTAVIRYSPNLGAGYRVVVVG